MQLTHLAAPASGCTAGTVAAAVGIASAAELGNANGNDHGQHCRSRDAQQDQDDVRRTSLLHGFAHSASNRLEILI